MENYLSGQRMTGNTCRTATSPAFRPASLSEPILDWDWRFGLKDQSGGSSLTVARSGSACINLPGGIVAQVGPNVPRYQPNGLILEGPAQNVALWSNSFTAAKGHTLNDCTTSVSPTEYLLTDESGAPRYATTLTATANIGRVGRYNISVTAGTPVSWSIHVKAISGKFRFAGYDGSKAVSVLFDCSTRTFSNLSDPGAISSQLQYEYIGNGWYRLSVTITPTVTSSTAAASIGMELAGNSGYISCAQFVERPVVTSYIYTEAVAITRASEGADTSGNGLSIPLSQAMVDSLRGELNDKTVAWIGASAEAGKAPTTNTTTGLITWPGGTTGYSVAYKTGGAVVKAGFTYEINYTLSGCADGSGVRLALGTTNGTMHTTDGTYTERLTCAGTDEIKWNALQVSGGFSGSVLPNYIRRVFESGQTNPGEGTVLCSVYLPWAPNSSVATTNILSPQASTAAGAPLYLSSVNVHCHDGVNFAGVSRAGLGATPGRYCLISQWSAAIGKMRVGLYNPATGALTWSSYSTYRGFFPIHASNRLRWFYGGGNFPIYALSTKWFNTILADTELIYHANRGL